MRFTESIHTLSAPRLISRRQDLLVITRLRGNNTAVVIWTEASVAELEVEREWVTVEVTPAGDWTIGSIIDELKGSAGSLEAGKLASAGALANLVKWFREWWARLDSGQELLIIEVPEDDGITYIWHVDRFTRHHKSGDKPTLEAAQAAAIQAARSSMVKKTRSPKKIKRMAEVETAIYNIRFPPSGPLDRQVRITRSGGTTITGKVTGGSQELHPPDQVSAYVILTDSDGETHTIDLLDVVSVDPGPADKNSQN